MNAVPLSVPGMPSEFGSLLSFIRAPLAATADAFMDWQRPLFNPSRTNFPGGLASHATELLPIEEYPSRRDLLVGTVGDEWTAFFESFPVLNRPPHGASVLRNQLNADVLEVYLKPFADEGTDPRTDPGLHTPGRGTRGSGLTRIEYTRPGIEASRTIVLQEWHTATSRYAFVQKGPVQPWEDSKHYNKRLKRDRFTPEILESYCKELGIDVFNLDFYAGPSVFMERTKFDTEQEHPDATSRSALSRWLPLPWLKHG